MRQASGALICDPQSLGRSQHGLIQCQRWNCASGCGSPNRAPEVSSCAPATILEKSFISFSGLNVRMRINP